MNLNEIIERFTLVSGLKMNEVSRYLPLIADCKGLFEERVTDVLSEARQRRLAHACAVYAYYRICLLLRDGGLDSFKAGDVQMNTAQIAEICAAAQRMWDTERAVIADIASFDDGFAFRSVSV